MLIRIETAKSTRRLSGKIRKIASVWPSEANLSAFLILVVVAAFVLPLTNWVGNHLQAYLDVTYSLLLISGVAIAWGNRLLFRAASIVTLTSLLVRWASWWYPSLAGLRERTMVASILFIIGILLVQVFRPGRITAIRIQGAIAAYLLLGMAWAHTYQFAYTFAPNAFSCSGGPLNSFADWVYFSFATLTTLGYGDIVPRSRLARTLATGEALTGQLYIATLIARLVSLHETAGTALGPVNPREGDRRLSD